MSRYSNKGFTIIELMLVVAVMGIMAMIALPAFNDMVQNNRRVSSVNDFLASMHIARSEAITRGQRVSVCRSNASRTACVGAVGSWRDGWLVFSDLNGDGAINGDDEILSTGGPLRGNFNMISSEFTSHMTFQPSGRVRASSGDNFGEMLLCEGDAAAATRVIIIERTGRPRIDTEVIGGGAGDCAS